MSIARVLHRLALLAYPLAFRREFGDELQRIFDSRIKATASRSASTLLTLYLLADAVISGAGERWRRIETRWTWPRHTDHFQTNRSRTMTWESIRNDLRLALRQCRRAPLFAALTVASLALGIGANSAMFGVVNAVLLQPLPYQDPGALVMVWSDNTNAAAPSNPVSPADFEAFKAAPSFASAEAMYSFLTNTRVRIDDQAEPEPAIAATVTPGMFALLGRSPLIGTTFAGAQEGIVLSHGFWQRRFGGDPGVLGRSLAFTGSPGVLPILGVMPKDFTFPYGSMLGMTGFIRSVEVDMWLPLTRHRDARLVNAAGEPNRDIHYLGVVGRLEPGARFDTARSELQAIAKNRTGQFPDSNRGWGVTVRPLHEQTVGALRPALLILLGGVGVVLLITCINVANVLLARAAGRGRDLAIRSALGASRRRLIQQMLTESLLLSLAGGVAGLGVMIVATRGIIALAPAELPRLSEVSPGLPVALFALALSILTGFVVGILPASSAARSQAQDTLRDGTRATASPARRRVGSALIVAEIALAMVLTVSGGLLLRSFVSVLQVDPGFRAENLLTFQTAVPPRYGDAAARLAYFEELEARLRALPGVIDVGGTTRLPLGSTQVTTMLEVEGKSQPRSEWTEVEMRRSVFDFFAAMQIPVIRGRGFSRTDDGSVPPVVVVNTTLATRVFGDEDPIGKRVRFGPGEPPWMTIVGVVGSIKHGTLEEVPKPELYINYRQGPPTSPFVVLRTKDDPASLAGAVRQALRDLGAESPTDVRTMEAIRGRSVAGRRFVLLLVGLFGVLSLALAALGVFGVITLVATERTTEVGIRLALGATPSQVMTLIVTQALHLAAAGIVVGGVVALIVAPLLKAQLFGVAATDPVTFAGVALMLALTATAAAMLPARRAMRVDPANALRG